MFVICDWQCIVDLCFCTNLGPPDYCCNQPKFEQKTDSKITTGGVLTLRNRNLNIRVVLSMSTGVSPLHG